MSTELPMGAEERVEATTPDGAAEGLLWWTHTPTLPGEKIGVIGGFRATSATATSAVLARAGEQLRAQRCTLAVGPMDGNTWRRYRFSLNIQNLLDRRYISSAQSALTLNIGEQRKFTFSVSARL